MAVAEARPIIMPRNQPANDISIVVPVFDEQDSLPPLTAAILKVAAQHKLDLRQLIFVDDGSRDGSWAVLERLAAANPVVTAIRLRRNFGKSMALNAGIEVATGSIIVTMDADLQDDPAELPRLLAPLAEGYDLVSGWRERRDDPLSKTLPSRLYNAVTARLSGISLHDFNCGYKVYRREIFDSVEIYGELHRYVPVLAHSLGFKVGEVAVQHHARKHGVSKYGFRRFLRGFLDLLTVLTITRYSRTPGHLFGAIGTVLLLLGVAVLAYLTGIKLLDNAKIGDRPLLMFGALSVIVGLQVTLFGLLSEMINSRTDSISPRKLIKERVPDED